MGPDAIAGARIGGLEAQAVRVGAVRPVAGESERSLVERAQRGERQAFEELVRRHADRLYSIVLRFVADGSEAEEVTQEAFLRAWRNIGSFRGDSQFFTWLYRIGINEAKRRAGRRRPAELVGSLEDDAVPEVPDWSEAPQRRLEQADLREVLERAIRKLPFRYRATVILRDVEGLSTREAAEMMDLSEAAFKSRLHRARLSVRRALEGYLPEEGR